jgi:TrmH family RNA methyltransferase
MEVLSSRDNTWLKRFRAALRGRAPDTGGAIGIEGRKMLEEAVRSGLRVEAVLVSELGARHLVALRAPLPPGVRVLRTSDRLFVSVSGTETPQGIAALVHPRTWNAENILRGADTLVVVLVALQDPGNVGTIVRTAEAFGASGVVAARGTANPYAPKALRASAGSALRIPMLVGLAPSICLAQLKLARVTLIVTSLEIGSSPAEVDWHGPCAILIGNEGGGLPPEVERSADVRVKIPMVPGVDSLNAAVAASVLLYEAARQRRYAT